MALRKSFTNCVFTLIIIFFIAVPQLIAQTSHSVDQKSFLWEIKSSTTTTYILGSIHFASASFYPLNKNIENAYNSSSVLAVELNPLTQDNAKVQEIIVNRGLYQGEETIQDNISEDTFNILNNFFINNSVASQGFLKMKPGLLALTLSTIKIAQMGFSPEYGIDMYFCRKATEDKSIIELETMEEQLSLILDMPNQDSYLKYTLHDLEKFDELFEKLIKSWRTGDHKAMENIAIKPYEKDYELQPIFERMYYDRNIRMTSKIKKFLRGNQKVFVVVGAAHLIGEKGIIQLLQKENYSVKQL